jgi:YihY family inner membrane protein
MHGDRQAGHRVLAHPGRFIWGVLKGFRANQGLLLSGALAYNTLLSIIPLFTLLLLVLSHVVSEAELLNTVKEYLEFAVPAPAQETVLLQINAFLAQRHVAGWVVLAVMLFFSSIAFAVLESAMAIIFRHRTRRRRHLLVSALIPYMFISLLGVGLLVTTFIAGVLQAIEQEHIVIFGSVLPLTKFSVAILYVLGVVGQILMLTAIYLVMPVGRLSFKHALIGGVTAGVLWEITRHILVWYFETLSLVNVVYGSLATTIVGLLSLEVGGGIVLLGAQVIAEYERLGQSPDNSIESP